MNRTNSEPNVEALESHIMRKFEVCQKLGKGVSILHLLVHLSKLTLSGIRRSVESGGEEVEANCGAQEVF